MNISEINSLIAQFEGIQIEFKETTGQLDRGMESLCAFLNGEGGKVLFGITDNGEIIGQELSDKTKCDIAEAIKRIEPFANIEVSYVDIPEQNKAIIVLSAERQTHARPFSYKGKSYIRIESVTSVMPQDMYSFLALQKGGIYSWDSMINPDLKVTDLNEKAILDAVRGGVRSGRLPDSTINEDIPTILKKFNLLHDGGLNNASAVLFGNDLYQYPQCLLRLARFKGTTKDEFIDNQRVVGNIYELLDAAMAFFFKHLSLSGKIEGLYRNEELSVPYKALRECCVNAFCHKAYHRPGSSVGIAIYDDRVEIENSGAFPPDITVEKLLEGHNSEPLNLVIANVLYKSAVLENWGRGIALMVNECKRVGMAVPEFNTNGTAVWVTFRYSRTTIGSNKLTQVTPQVTPQVLKLISNCNRDYMSIEEMMSAVRIIDRKYFRKSYLTSAIELGFIEPLHSNNPFHPQQRYKLTEAAIRWKENNGDAVKV